MKNKTTVQRKFMFAALLTVTMAISAAAQQPETFRVTQIVETDDGRTCRVLEVKGRTAKVGCGESGTDIRVYKFEQMTSQAAAYWKRDAERRKQQAELDAAPKQETVIFKQGDAVQTPDGRTGKIESFKDEVMAKVRFGTGAGDTQYFMLSVLKKAQAPSKEVLKVGDTVSASYVRNGEPGRIESINGNLAKVRYGPGNYDFVNVEISDLIGPRATAAARENAEQEMIQKPMRAQFADEAEPFMRTVKILAHTYNPQFFDHGDSFTGTAADHEAWRKDLEALAAICRKYPNLTNEDTRATQSIELHPADVCKLAEQRTSVIAKTRSKLGDLSADQEIRSWSMKLNDAANGSEGLIDDDLQMLLYERAKWEQAYLKNLKKKYTDRGAQMSPEVFKPLDEFAAEIKVKIENDAQNREWEKPNFTDAALEALAKRQFAADFPGVQVLKTGMTYTTWKEMDKTSLLGSDSTWKYYKVTPGAYRYKLGLALVKMPNRPMCQIRGFQLTQQKAGAGFGAAKASVAEAGIFVKCP